LRIGVQEQYVLSLLLQEYRDVLSKAGLAGAAFLTANQ
jgi:hypothetical protein